MARRPVRHGFYMASGISHRGTAATTVLRKAACTRRPETGSIPMLDIVYLLIGAVFLGGCVLYAIACDHL
jgi:hypothetical protein